MKDAKCGSYAGCSVDFTARALPVDLNPLFTVFHPYHSMDNVTDNYKFTYDRLIHSSKKNQVKKKVCFK